MVVYLKRWYNDKLYFLSIDLKIGGVKADDFQQFLDEVSELFGDENKVTYFYDNCRAHLSATTICPNHALIRLPPYSPFLNPIEEAFSFLKNFVRYEMVGNVDYFRSKEKFIYDRIKIGLGKITDTHCESWVAHSFQYYPKCILSRDIL